MGTEADLQTARAAFERGLAHLEAEDAAAAEAALREALALAPGRPSVLAALGVALLQQARAAPALAAFDDALAAEPQRAETWGHRGNALLALARPADALASFERALAAGAPAASVDFHRAAALNQLRRHGDALQCLETVQRAHPQDALVALNRAFTLRCLDRHAEALPALRLAVQHGPQLGAAWSALGQLLKDSPDPADRAEAAAAFERAIALGEDAELQRWFLAGLDGPESGTAPAVAPLHYVAPLFDGYADTFDQHADTLQYGAPTRLASLIATVRAEPVAAALDLGCGTGQCAAPLAALAGAVDGVDVSAAMLDVARAGGRYRALHHAEAVAWLSRTDERYGLVVAADVFIYIGALDEVFAQVRRVLEPGGLFAFTVEIAAGTKAFELLRTLRYAHRERDLIELAQREGFRVALTHRAPLRLEQGQPLPGLYLVLQTA